MVHTVHTNRDKQGWREGRGGVWETEGERGGQDIMGCALFGLNKEKQLSHTPPPILEIKKTNKIFEPP